MDNIEPCYAVIYTEYKNIDDGYGSDYRFDYDVILEFDTEDQLKKWILENDLRLSTKKIKKIIRFQELKMEKKVEISLV